MTTHHREPVSCACGHEGIVHWSENDQPFSKQWEQWSISGFEGEGFYLDGGYTHLTAALDRMKPKCPACGEVGKIKQT